MKTNTTFVVLPLLIIMARVVDVSLDTIRVIMIAKGYKNHRRHAICEQQ